MTSIGNGKATRIGANGESVGNKSLGKVPSRPLGRITEQVAMPAFLKAKGTDCLHHQVTCAQGRGMGNKGNGWRINGNEAKVSGPAIATFMKPSNYKDHQRAKRK